MSKKIYFRDEEEENCWHLSYYKGVMKNEQLNELILIEAEIEYDTDHFFCDHFLEVGLKSEGGCGTVCESYSPRNGKNGRCTHSKNCYIPTDKKIKLKKTGKKFLIESLTITPTP